MKFRVLHKAKQGLVLAFMLVASSFLVGCDDPAFMQGLLLGLSDAQQSHMQFQNQIDQTNRRLAMDLKAKRAAERAEAQRRARMQAELDRQAQAAREAENARRRAQMAQWQAAQARNQTRTRIPLPPTNYNSNHSSSSNQRTSPPREAPKNTNPTALVVTWQNKYGKWWASGPTQTTSTSEETEAKAMKYAYPSYQDTPRYLKSIGRFKIYTLGRPLQDSDFDVRRTMAEHLTINIP